ncbi:MAG: protein kinase domain-containing protein [Planctomycetota bacterium]|jgi:predicted Zn finger-like uncharacterized protein
MAKITVTCPKCLAHYRVDEAKLGKAGQCGKCSTTFTLVDGEDVQTRTLERPARDSRGSSVGGPASGHDASEIWNVGDAILDVYEVKPLGTESEREKHYAEGGMGVVYRVYHRGWDLDLAVKSPKAEIFETEQGKRDFERECKTWVELGLHPNIVTCYYVRRVDEIPRVFAEFVGGGSLEDWIRIGRLYEDGPEQTLERIIDIATQFAWGLHHAHKQGLIHQDVKPSNVMMHGEVPKVTDFGLAKARVAAQRIDPEATQSSMLVSWGGMTPAFCSPEQVEAAVQAESGIADGQRTGLTRRTDLWSWALTVFAMFYGKSPCRYGGQTAPQVFESYREREPTDNRLPRIPDSLARLIRRCFQVKPGSRPSSMSEVADCLAEVYREVTARRYPRQEPVTAELMANSLNNRAVSLLDLGKQREAGRLLEKAWRQHPWQPQVTHNRGLLEWRAGRMTDVELVTELEELCKTRPRDWCAAHSLGLAQLERGEVKLAVKAFEQAAALGGGLEVDAVLDQAQGLVARAPRCVRSFSGRPPFLTTVLLSDDGHWAASGVDQQKLRIWDVATGRSKLALDVPVHGPTSSSDGRWELSTGAGQTLCLADLETPGHTQTFRRITWGPSPSTGVSSDDGQWEVTAGDEYTLQFRESSKNEPVHVFRGHVGPVNSVVFSGNGRWVLSGSSDKTLRLWEVATGECVRTLKGHTHTVNAVFLSDDARWALSASSGHRLRLWDLELLSEADRFAAPVLLCHVTTSEEAGRTQVRFAALCQSARAAETEGRCAEALGLVRAARTLPGYEVAEESLELWLAVGKHCVRKGPRDAWCVQTFEGHSDDVRSVVLSPDARWLLSGAGDRTLRLWDASTGRCERTFNGHSDWVRSVALSDDGRYAVSGSWDKTLCLWDVATGRSIRTLNGHANYVNSVWLSGDGRQAFSASWDKTVKHWNVATGRCVRTFQGHANYVNAVCATRDARLVLSGSEDKTIRLWDAASGRSIRTFQGHADWVHSVCLSADGRLALSGGKDRTVRIWDVATGDCRRVFEGHTGPVISVFLAADCRWALSGSKDKTMRLWDVATGKCRHVFQGHTGLVTSVRMSVDGRWALSGGEDRTVRLWEIDWDYEFPGWSDWHDDARSHLETFLTLHCPLTDDGLTRRGRPTWGDDDFQQLLRELQDRGLGWLRAEGLRRQLEAMTDQWRGPPPLDLS